eukprot:8833289-Lingulodinium_polyedra.AAC.1
MESPAAWPSTPRLITRSTVFPSRACGRPVGEPASPLCASSILLAGPWRGRVGAGRAGGGAAL